MATSTGPSTPAVTIEPLRSCQPAAISWTWPGAAAPYTVDVFSNQSGEEELLTRLPAHTTSVRWAEVDLAAGWRVTFRVSSALATNTTQNIDSGLQAVLPCPPGEACTCTVRPVPGWGSSTTSSPSVPPSSTPTSTSPTSTSPTGTRPSSTSSISRSPSSTQSSHTQSSTFTSPTVSSSSPPVVQPSDSTLTITQTPSGSLQSQIPAPSDHSANTGLIVGTAVGGIAFIVILATLLFFAYRWCKKRNRRRKLEDEFDLDGQNLYPAGNHRDPSQDMEEVDNLTPYPFTAPMSYDTHNYCTSTWDVGHGWPVARFEHAPPAGGVGMSGVPSSSLYPAFASSSTSPTMPTASAATSYIPFPQPQPIRRNATTTALATAPAREAKLQAERRRTSSLHQSRPSTGSGRPRPPPVQAEDGGFVADGGEVPPSYRPEWEAAQRERLGHGEV